MTKLIFLEDSYLRELETKVIKVLPEGIVVEETIFYPRSGGQDVDKGYVEWNGQEFRVNDVQKIGHEILLKTGQNQIKEGDKVNMVLDWERRYKFMKYHTAAHILSAIVFKETGALITGNQIEENKGRIDFNLENFDREKINEYEKTANNIIAEVHEVKVYELKRDDAMKIESIFRLRNVLPKSLDKFGSLLILVK